MLLAVPVLKAYPQGLRVHHYLLRCPFDWLSMLLTVHDWGR